MAAGVKSDAIFMTKQEAAIALDEELADRGIAVENRPNVALILQSAECKVAADVLSESNGVGTIFTNISYRKESKTYQGKKQINGQLYITSRKDSAIEAAEALDVLLAEEGIKIDERPNVDYLTSNGIEVQSTKQKRKRVHAPSKSNSNGASYTNLSYRKQSNTYQGEKRINGKSYRTAYKHRPIEAAEALDSILANAGIKMNVPH